MYCGLLIFFSHEMASPCAPEPKPARSETGILTEVIDSLQRNSVTHGSTPDRQQWARDLGAVSGALAAFLIARASLTFDGVVALYVPKRASEPRPFLQGCGLERSFLWLRRHGHRFRHVVLANAI